MQKVIPRCLSFRRLIIKITVSVFWRWDLPIYPCCCVVGFFFVCLFHFFSPTLPHFTRVEKCESYYGNRSEMIFCSHSARQIGVDVIHLGCRPCCKCIILPQPLSTHVCTEVHVPRDGGQCSLACCQVTAWLCSVSLQSGCIRVFILGCMGGEIVPGLLLPSLPRSTMEMLVCVDSKHGLREERRRCGVILGGLQIKSVLLTVWLASSRLCHGG